jgi:hypothetical protein
LARDFFFAGFSMPFVDPADEAPLAEVSPAPLETPAPLAPGAIVSAFAAPADVDAFGIPAPCARTSGDADTARHRINCWKVRFNAISFSLVEKCLLYWTGRMREGSRAFRSHDENTVPPVACSA